MASLSFPCPKVTPTVAASSQPTPLLYRFAAFPRSDPRSNHALTIVAQPKGCGRGKSDVFRVCAQLNEVALEKKSNGSPVVEKELKKSEGQYEIPDAAAISTFMNQVTDFVQLVDTKDIVELQLKQMDCEVLIRKKEALPQPSAPAPAYYAPPPSYQAIPPPPPASAPASAASAPSSPATAPAPVAKPKSSHPPFKCPMAGNFYRSPAPGAPPFVKVGDKVQKGQVICIIEAMKLMNEIEADHSGTVVEILADDGKPVSVDTPLFIIAP